MRTRKRMEQPVPEANCCPGPQRSKVGCRASGQYSWGHGCPYVQPRPWPRQGEVLYSTESSPSRLGRSLHHLGAEKAGAQSRLPAVTRRARWPGLGSACPSGPPPGHFLKSQNLGAGTVRPQGLWVSGCRLHEQGAEPHCTLSRQGCSPNRSR